MNEILAACAFFGIKFLAYAVYCRWGIDWLGGPDPRWRRAAGCAAARLAMGVLLGAGLMALLSQPAGSGNRLGLPEWFGWWGWTYGISYGILRTFVWGLTARLVKGRPGTWGGREAAWTAGGVAISFAADIAGFAAAIRVAGGIC